MSKNEKTSEDRCRGDFHLGSGDYCEVCGEPQGDMRDFLIEEIEEQLSQF